MDHVYFESRGRPITFQADDRVDAELFLLAAEALNALDKVLAGLPIKASGKERSSQILVVYYATRLYGATAAGAMLLSHRLGKEAIILGRAQYEYFTRMLYYDHFKTKADDALKVLPLHKREFAKKAQLKVAQNESEAEQELAFHPSVEDFAQIREALKRDPKFTRNAGTDPFVKSFCDNLTAAYSTHWVYGSTITHAGIADIDTVVLPRKDKSGTEYFLVNVDSRMSAPNRTLADLAQRCFTTTVFLYSRFGKMLDSSLTTWAERFSARAELHKDEVATALSMHDM